MSDTPRTDAFFQAWKLYMDSSLNKNPGSLGDFARELERELNQRNQACDDYAKTIYSQADEIRKLKA